MVKTTARVRRLAAGEVEAALAGGHQRPAFGVPAAREGVGVAEATRAGLRAARRGVEGWDAPAVAAVSAVTPSAGSPGKGGRGMTHAGGAAKSARKGKPKAKGGSGAKGKRGTATAAATAKSGKGRGAAAKLEEQQVKKQAPTEDVKGTAEAAVTTAMGGVVAAVEATAGEESVASVLRRRRLRTASIGSAGGISSYDVPLVPAAAESSAPVGSSRVLEAVRARQRLHRVRVLAALRRAAAAENAGNEGDDAQPDGRGVGRARDEREVRGVLSEAAGAARRPRRQRHGAATDDSDAGEMEPGCVGGVVVVGGSSGGGWPDAGAPRGEVAASRQLERRLEPAVARTQRLVEALAARVEELGAALGGGGGGGGGGGVAGPPVFLASNTKTKTGFSALAAVTPPPVLHDESAGDGPDAAGLVVIKAAPLGTTGTSRAANSGQPAEAGRHHSEAFAEDHGGTEVEGPVTIERPRRAASAAAKAAAAASAAASVGRTKSIELRASQRLLEHVERGRANAHELLERRRRRGVLGAVGGVAGGWCEAAEWPSIVEEVE
ncbi:hypothetical protein HK405_011675, partial [Cladochytrium tenue]